MKVEERKATATPRTKPNVGVGMPAWLELNEFGALVRDAFGWESYLVGSAAVGKVWRDVDVRLILPDDEWERWFGVFRKPMSLNPKWCSLVRAYSALAKAMTGLPVDFQIQQRTDANATFPNQVRCALILPFRVPDNP